MYSKSDISAATGTGNSTVHVWDLPTRLFHWSLVVLVVFLFVTGKIGGEALVWHARAAFLVASLLLFRVSWGLWGGHWSRFSQFPLSSSALFAQMHSAKEQSAWTGHSPSGAMSIVSMLLVLGAQVLSGAFSADKGEFFGPLTPLIGNTLIKAFTWYHKNVGQFALFALVGMHLLAIAYYQFVKDINLIVPMLSGDKPVEAPVENSRDDAVSRIVALAILALCALSVVLFLKWVG
jgi:cytochrome b